MADLITRLSVLIQHNRPYFSMTKAECVEIAYIAKGHGLRGEVKAVFDVHDITEYKKGMKVYLAKKDAALVPVKITQMRISNDKHAILAFEEISDRNQADALRGSTLYYPQALLPKLSEGHFYYFELIGFSIVDKKLGKLGTVQEIVDADSQEIMVMDYQEKEVLIPMNDEFVGTINREKKEISTSLPDGLLELYV